MRRCVIAIQRVRESLRLGAVALRPVRILPRTDTLRVYEATTFPGPDGPWAGCELYLRRLEVVGGFSPVATDLILDVLNANGDIIQDFYLTKKGFEYLRSTLKFKVVPESA